MNHAIEVQLSANIDKYKAGMDAAKKMGSESLGFIASIFDKIKTMFSGIWDSFKSFFSGGADKFKSTFGSMSDSASGAFQKMSGYFSGFNSDLDKSKAKMGETEKQSSSLASNIVTGLVAAFVAVTAVVGVLVAKGMALDATFAGIAISSGIAVSQLSRFDGVAARSGVGVKDLGTSMTKFQEAMAKAAAGDGSDVFAKMGVKVADSNNALLKTDDVLINVSKKIAGMSTETEKYAAAAKLGFDGKVQVLEDIAHASDLSARVTDEQGAAVKRLGAIWHEILPSGQSMWSTISDKLTNSLMPAMTTASVSILESKNRIVEAFSQIYGGGSFLDKLSDKIRDWSKSASTWFAGVEKSATDMTISVMKYIAAKTGLGNADAFKPSGTGYIPAVPKLTGDKGDPITTDAEKAAKQQFDQTTKSVADRIAIMKEQIKNGAVLTEGQRALLQLDNADLKLSPEKLAAAKAQATALDSLEKQFKSQQDAKTAAAAASKKEEEQYASLISAIQSKVEANKIELAAGAEATDSQKMLIKLDADLASGKLKLSDTHEKAARAALQELGVTEQQIKATKDFDAAMKAINAAGDADINSLDAEIAKQKEHNAEIGKTKEQIELARQAQAQAAAEDMLRESKAIDALLNQADLQGIIVGKDRELYAARLAYLDKEILKRNTLATLHADGADLEAGAKAAADLDKYLNPDKANAFGTAFKGAMSTAARSMTDLTSAMQKYGDEQKKNEQARAAVAIASKGDSEQRAKAVIALDEINRRSTEQQLAGYGSMASAAAGFFGEHSRGYQALMAVSEVFHAAELAMNLASIAPAMAAGAAQMFAQSGWGGFAGVAAMAAVVAGFGVAVSGGGNANVSANRQAAQGAGTVLGDDNAKSDSIKKSLDMIDKNTFQGLAINSSMLTTLRSIDSNIASFASQLVKSTDISNPSLNLNTNNGLASTIGTAGLTAGGAAIGGIAGAGLTAFTSLGAVGGPIGMVIGAVAGAIVSKIPAVASLMTSIFGGKQSVSDSGFTLDKTSLGAALAGGVNGVSYADITTSGGLFRSSSSDTKTTALGDAADQQFSAIIKSLAGSITQAGQLLGASGDDFTNQLNTFVIDIGKVSLKGMTGDEIQKALESVFSKLGDQMAQFAVGGLQQFQQVGEGYLETLTRLATEYQTVDVVFQSFGKTFGTVGMASIEARDRLVQLAGGLDKFTSQGEYFLTNFFSDQEQAAALKKRIDPTLTQYGLSSEGENAAQTFRDFVVSLDTTTAAGAQAYTTLMTIAPALKTIVDAGKDALDERKSLQDKLDDLTMTSAQLHEKERATINASNLALYDRVSALQAEKDSIQAVKDAGSALLGGVDSAFSVLQKVVEREKAAIQTTVDAHQAAVNVLQGLSDTVKSTLASLSTSDQKMMERSRAQAEIHADLAITKAGGTLSTDQVASLKTALGAVTQDASSQFSTYSDYLKDLYKTQSDIAQLGKVTDTQLSVEQKALTAAQDQLKSLDSVLSNAQDQIDVMKGQSITLLSIDQGIAGLKDAILAAQANPVVAAGSAINGAYQQYLGRSPDAAGLQWWQNAAASGTPVSQIVDGIKGSTESSLNTLYQSVLGRAPDAQGLAFWMNAYGPTMDAGETADWMKAAQGSDEYKKLHPFAVGTNFVPETMPALVHQGERIIPAADNRALMARLSSPSSNTDALVAEVKALREEVKAFRIANSAENLAAVKHAAKSADALDGAVNGTRPLVTASSPG
jgi:hypothetical protein